MKRFIQLLMFAVLFPATMFAQTACQTENANANEDETLLSVAAPEQNSVRFFINPVTNLLQLTPSAEMNNALLIITDVRGRMVAKESFREMPAGQATQYQMNEFNPGIYVFVLQGENFRFSEKIMVQ